MNPRKVCLILTIQSFCDPQLESVVHFVFLGMCYSSRYPSMSLHMMSIPGLSHMPTLALQVTNAGLRSGPECKAGLSRQISEFPATFSCYLLLPFQGKQDITVVHSFILQQSVTATLTISCKRTLPSLVSLMSPAPDTSLQKALEYHTHILIHL